MGEEKEKVSAFRRILRVIKKIIYKTCGKARWLLLTFLLLLGLQCIYINEDIASRINGTEADDGTFPTEVSLEDVMEFSINENGDVVVTSDYGYYGLGVTFDAETGKTKHLGAVDVDVDPLKYDGFTPEHPVITEDGTVYAVRPYYKDYYNDRVYTKETIVKIDENYRYVDEIYTLTREGTESKRSSIVSNLGYYDGIVSFATVGRDAIRLYRLDTATGNVSVSRDYTPDADGTYTANVIPVDGDFLFVRSDGTICRTAFDEPIGEVICKFDPAKDDACITDVVNWDGTLYGFDGSRAKKVYRLEKEGLREEFDITACDGREEDYIVGIGTYKKADTGEEALAVCLWNGLLSYEAGRLTDITPVFELKTPPLRYVKMLIEFVGAIIQYMLIINLFIRRKTVFYKQMVIMIPAFFIVTVVITTKLYGYFTVQNMNHIRTEGKMICDYMTKSLEGYDFSDLCVADGNTGEAYRELNDTLREIKAAHADTWSDDFELSVICRTGITEAAVLAYDDRIVMPFGEVGELYSEDDFKGYDSTGDIYVAEQINSFLSNDANESEIATFERIDDADGAGDYYLKVRTLNRKFWYQRRQMLLAMITYGVLILGLVIAITALISLYITRAARKATEAVQRIANGDLSARVKYKSKDELGEICTQVNAMGQSLEQLFTEKDATEKFYYKFVPEQFRTLLGKEEFTDLSLGDSCSRELTVLFCDIRSFSINSEIMTAKENFEFVNIIYGIAGPIIRENGGFVDKYIGDAIMALFESADDAVRCGIEIYRAIVLDTATAERLGISDINIGIGIHSGMASVGIVGETERLSGTVISDTVNLSSRLESLTKQYKTAMLVSKDTVDRMSDPDSLDMRYLGIVQVAGVNEVKAVYEVLDSLPDEEREKRHENAHNLREAIRLFHLGRRDETVQMLRSIASSGKGDHVTDMYLDYMTKLSAEDKGNVFRFVRK